MYAILSGGAMLALCDKPRYVRKNPESGAYVEAEKAEAEGLAVNGSLYNLPGSNAIPDAPEATVREQELCEVVFGNLARIEENEAGTGEAIVRVENAMCEQDAANDERMSAIEDAVCELDAAINKG